LLQLKRSAILVRASFLEVFKWLFTLSLFFHPSYTLDVQWLLDCNNIYGRLAALLGVGIHGGMGELFVYRLLPFAFPSQVDT
jgi:hypothetical protein